MAYRFNNSTDYVEFAIAPFVGNTFGAFTMAAFVKRSGTDLDQIVGLTNASLGTLINWVILDNASGNQLFIQVPSTSGNGAFHLTGTTIWYLVAVTRATSGSTPRFHIWNGTAWTHEASSGGSGALSAIGGTDRLRCPALTFPFGGDMVCAGIRLADSSDVTVETLSPTAFAAWRAFGFDWLVGFDTSLQSAGVLQDQASPGTGDQTAISGTSVVSDPPGWSWAPAAAPVANFTGTPTSGTASLSVAFTDSSTNIPTSWSWTFGDGGTSSSQNPSHSYTTSGAYTVTLVATNATGSDTKTRTGYVSVGEAISYASGGGIFIY